MINRLQLPQKIALLLHCAVVLGVLWVAYLEVHKAFLCAVIAAPFLCLKYMAAICPVRTEQACCRFSRDCVTSLKTLVAIVLDVGYTSLHAIVTYIVRDSFFTTCRWGECLISYGIVFHLMFSTFLTCYAIRYDIEHCTFMPSKFVSPSVDGVVKNRSGIMRNDVDLVDSGEVMKNIISLGLICVYIIIFVYAIISVCPLNQKF